MSNYIDLIELANKKETTSPVEKIDKIIFGLLLVVIGFIPLIVLGSMQQVQSPVISYISQMQSARLGDLFGYYKVIALIIVTSIIAILFFVKVIFYNDPIRKTFLNWLIGAAILVILLSTILSPAATIALTGHYTRVEGAFTWLCYMLLFFFAMNIRYPEHTFRYVVWTLVPFVFINFYIIIRHFYGNPIFQTDFIRDIVTSTLGGGTVSKNANIVGTLNQWNNMSGMFAIMTVLFVGAAIFDRNNSRSTIFYVVALVSVAVLLMSISTAGFLTVLMMFGLLIIYAFRYGFLKRAAIVIGTFLILTLPIIHVLSTENPRVFRESLGFVIKDNPYVVSTSSQSPTSATSATNNKQEDENETVSITTANGEYSLPVLPERGNAALASRVYIWDKTIEILKDRPVFGYGMDTFMYYFPHYNIDARAGMMDEHPVVGKAHSVYFGLMQGVGYIGFLPFLALFLSILAMTLMPLIRKPSETFSPFILLGIAFVTYMIQGIVNDSVPGVSAPLWVIAAIAMAHILPKKVEQ